MKKLGLFCLPVLAITLLLGGNAFAQNKGDNSYYFVTYFSNANTAGAPDATLRIVNDGDASTSQKEGQPNGLMGAEILVFDDSQELQECCGCLISADGLLSESVNNELTANTLTGRPVTRGVIKIVGVSLVSDKFAPGLRGTMTHIQATPGPNGLYSVTEAPLADSNLSTAELDALEQLCSFTFTLGSGQGICSCTEEDEDF
jgi:hypothetical protein